MRLIDADYLLKYWKISHNHGSCDNCEIRGLENCTKYTINLDDICDSIDDAPTINAAPIKNASWIVLKVTMHGGYFKCDCCNYINNSETNYCPNCGAKMEREYDEL